MENPFENVNCLAVIYNEHFNYTMLKSEVFFTVFLGFILNFFIKITFGRSKTVDVDLSSYELFSKKISRVQMKISMIESNLFILFNLGKIQIYVDGKIVEKNKKTQIFDKSIIEVNMIFFQIKLDLYCERILVIKFL